MKTLEFYRPNEKSDEIQYLKERRKALGGYIPSRSTNSKQIKIKDPSIFESSMKSSGDRELSTTMALVAILGKIFRDKEIAPKLVPIIPDEARTFGMEGFFKRWYLCA